VSDTKIIEATTPEMGDAALVAMRQWLFEPARRGSAPVASRIRVPFHFAPPPPAPQVAEGATVETPGIQASGTAGGRGAGTSSVAAPAPTPPANGQPRGVTVFGRGRAASRGAGDYDFKIGRLAAVPRRDAASLLRLAPGVFLTNEGGAGHPYQIFLRGFDAREGQDIEMTADDVPVNDVGNIHGNGLADTHFIIPELVQSLRVVEGPFAPQQGNFAVAGSANYELGLEERGLTASVTTGSFGTKRLLLLWGPAGHSTHTFGGVEAFHSDGFGQNRASDRATAMAGYEGALGDTARFNVLLTSYATHYAQAGLLRLDDLKAGRKGFYDTYDTEQGGDSSRHGLALRVEDKLDDTLLSQLLFVTARSFRLRENLTGFLQDPQETWQNDHPQRGDLIDQRSRTLTFGGRGSARRQLEVLGRTQQLELGFLARHDSVDSVQQRDRSGSIIPYRKDLDLSSSLSNVGLYADAVLSPFAYLSLRGGLRADFYHYDVENMCAVRAQSSFGGDAPDTECFSSDRTGYRSPDQTASTSALAFQPRATVIVGPFNGVSFSISRGAGTRSLDPQYINQNLDTPFVSVSASEGGASYVAVVGGTEISARSVFFQTHVDRDLFFNQTEGRSTLAGGTTRTGWAGNARVIGSFFDLAANMTLVRASFDDTHLLIPYVPNRVVRADGVLFGDLPRLRPGGEALRGTLAAGVSHVGQRALPFNELSSSILTVDAAATLRWGAAQIGVVCTNVLDTKYRLGEYNYTSDFRSSAFLPTQVAARHFAAGEPRALYATLTLHLGGGPS
jgi:iron complex outermembrane recepter protein